MDETPGRIDRAALERIIQRAAELQTGEREISDQLSPEDVLSLGKEVGIPTKYLQQAMLEERTRAPAPKPTGVMDRLMGPAEVAAQRVIRGEPEITEQRLISWMDENELVAIQRQQPGRVVWEPLRGMQVAFRRSAAVLGSAKRPFMLARAGTVSATITPLEAGYCHVLLTATLDQVRGSAIGGVLALSTVGVGSAAALAVMSPFWWVAAAPLVFFLALSYSVGRQFRPVATRTQLGLERALDHLERGEVKPGHELPDRRSSLIRLVADEVRKALMP